MYYILILLYKPNLLPYYTMSYIIGSIKQIILILICFISFKLTWRYLEVYLLLSIWNWDKNRIRMWYWYKSSKWHTISTILHYFMKFRNVDSSQSYYFYIQNLRIFVIEFNFNEMKLINLKVDLHSRRYVAFENLIGKEAWCTIQS